MSPKVQVCGIMGVHHHQYRRCEQLICLHAHPDENTCCIFYIYLHLQSTHTQSKIQTVYLQCHYFIPIYWKKSVWQEVSDVLIWSHLNVTRETRVLVTDCRSRGQEMCNPIDTIVRSTSSTQVVFYLTQHASCWFSMTVQKSIALLVEICTHS